MHFANDALAELETPTRIFRTDSTSNIQGFKNKTQSPLLYSLFSGKREMMELDEVSHHATSIRTEFFSDDIKKYRNQPTHTSKTTNLADKNFFETVLPIKQQKSIDSGCEKFKKVKTISKLMEDKTDIKLDLPLCNVDVSNNIPSQYQNPLQNISNEISNSVQAIKPIEIPQNSKYNKIVLQRKQGDSLIPFNRRKMSLSNNDRGYLRSRVTKVCAFWRGDNNFIPSVFKLLKFTKEPKRAIIELQDFSMKGLCHISDSFNQDDNDRDLTKQLDSLGDETLCESYEMTCRKINY